MPSLIWGRDAQEAFEQPYEYQAQEQFVREAKSLLTKLYKLINSEEQKHTREEKSVEKAIWLLVNDALDSLRDCLEALIHKDHRITGKQFRDIVESMDLAAFFNSNTDESNLCLNKWYNNEIVPHSKYRDYVRKTNGDKAAKQSANYYRNLSRFTHRSYHAILDGYVLGRDGKIVHDGITEIYTGNKESKRFLVLPQTISSYYAVLASLIETYANQLPDLKLVDQNHIQEAFKTSLETETIPRQFAILRTTTEIRLHSKNNDSF